jgi:hypothetical protein
MAGQDDNRSSDEAIARLANRQGGIVSRAQLSALGIGRGAVEHRLAAGRLRAVHRGVYAVGHDAVPVRGHLFAGLLVAGKGAALSHRSAAGVWRLTPSMPPFVEITTTIHRRSSRPGLIFHHATALETTGRHGLPLTTPIRTLRDLAATRPRAEVERAASEALVLELVTKQALQQQRGPGAAVLARLVGAGIGPTRSGLERAFLRAVVKSGLPEPLVGHRIGPYTADFFWPSHDLVVETDGDRYHGHEIAVRRDARRDAYLQLRGCIVLRVPEEELPGAAAAVARFLSRPASHRAS